MGVAQPEGTAQAKLPGIHLPRGEVVKREVTPVATTNTSKSPSSEFLRCGVLVLWSHSRPKGLVGLNTVGPAV